MLHEYDQQRQDACFRQAMAVYEERDAIRQGLWKEYQAEDQLRQAKIKIERCLQALKLGRPEDVLAEVPDIINYAAFAQRQCDGLEEKS